MKVIRFIGLFALSYFLLILVYVAVAAIVAFYEQAPTGERVTILARLLRDCGLSIFKDSTSWLVGSKGLYSFVPTVALIQSTDILRGLSTHCIVQLSTFGFLGVFATSRGCSLTMMLLLPICLIGLTSSLLDSRLLGLAHYNLTAVLIVIVSQVIGLFIGSTFSTSRLR